MSDRQPNTVVRHYGTSRADVPHLVTSAKFRTTLDPDKVTCAACHAAPPPSVVSGVIVTADQQLDPNERTDRV